MLGRRRGSWKTHLFLLLACVSLITDVAEGSEVDEADEVVAVEDDGSGGDTRGGSRGEEETFGARADMRGEMSDGSSGVVVVENGTSEAVVLDCPYQLDEKNLLGLHIKWYHHSNPNPVYEWIPEHEPTALWFLRDRVDLSYEPSTDPYHRHRALRILEPTTNIDGRYECRVSSFSKELTYTRDLIVFTEPSSVEVWVEERDEGQLAVICKVDEVYPQPVLYLYKKSSMKDSEALSGGTPITSSSRGTYSMEVEKVIEEATLEGLTEFECHAAIPNTELGFVTSTKYQPRLSLTRGAVIAGGSTPKASILLSAVLSLIPLSLLYA